MERQRHLRGLEERLGPDQMDFVIKQQAHDRGRQHTPSSSSGWFAKKSWLTACSEFSTLFCFPCLLSQIAGTEPAWNQSGVTD